LGSPTSRRRSSRPSVARSSIPSPLGIFGDWGSGKTSILGLPQAELARDESVVLLDMATAAAAVADPAGTGSSLSDDCGKA
jgi:hypothetical protein